MPVLAVNSEGVNAAMSFICGLSTIATLIEPVPEAGVPLAPELELLEPPPPQPAAITQATATAVADERRTVPLMVLSSCFNAEVGIPPQPIALIALVYVGCQATRPTIRRRIKPCCIRARVFEFRPMLASSV